MKKLLSAACLTVTVAFSSFAAGTTNVNAAVLHSFKLEFKNVSNVTWSTGSDYAKAVFVENNRKMEAFYNLDGAKIATSEQISLDELPVKAKRNFARKFAGFSVKEAIHFEGGGETAYYISAENEKESIIVKVSGNMDGSVFEITKKK
jgi:hypothetical protein